MEIDRDLPAPPDHATLPNLVKLTTLLYKNIIPWLNISSNLRSLKLIEGNCSHLPEVMPFLTKLTSLVTKNVGIHYGDFIYRPSQIFQALPNLKMLFLQEKGWNESFSR